MNLLTIDDAGAYKRILDHRLKYLLLYVTLSLVTAGTQLVAQIKIISGDSIVFVEKTIKKIDKNVNFTILPGPTYNSSQKLGFMVLPVIVYNINTNDTLSPPSSTALAIYFDFYGSWMVAAKQNFFWDQNKWRCSLGTGYSQLKMKFFGIGRDSVIITNDESNYVWMEVNGFYATATCYRNIVSKFFGGLEYNYDYSSIEGSDSASSTKLMSQGIEPGLQSESILVPSFVWDNRDNLYWTVKGYYASLNLHFANSLILSSYNYNILTGFVNGYHSLLKNNNRFTLAWHFNFQAGWGEIPYTRMATYGLSDDVTGYTRGKYVNNCEISAQTELRYDLWNFFAVGVYLGTGKVFSNFYTMGPSVWLPFGGARFYLNVMPSRNFRFRFDIAVARKDFGVYIGFGQGF
jgi:hypothetical protein